MLHFPLISVVIIGNSSLSHLYHCLNAFTKVDYPQDQLEYLIILPNHFPVASAVQSLPQVRIIQFDEMINWNCQTAREEGLFFVHGDYVQLIEASYSLLPKWLKTGLSFFAYQQIIGVVGNIAADGHHLVPELKLMQQEASQPMMPLNDGFYSTAILRQLYANYAKSMPGQTIVLPTSAKTIHVDETMAVVNNNLPVLPKSNRSLFGGSLRVLFSKYISVH